MDPEKTPDKSVGRQVLVVVGVLGAIAVNIAAFMLSADAINAVAEAAGISERISWAMVAAVDGLMVTGTVVFIANKLRGRSVVYPLAVLGSGVLLSIWCNALHAKAGGGHIVHLSNHTKMGVSAIPAVSLALSFHLIADMVKDSLGIAAETSDERSDSRPADVRESASATSDVSSVRRAPERLPDASQTASETSGQTSRQTSVKPAKKTQRTTTGSAKKKVSLRDQVRPILIESPEMNAADVARKIGREPTGHIRTTCANVLSELIESGTIDAPPLRIAQ